MPHLTKQNACQETYSNQCCPGLGCCCVGDSGFKFSFDEIVHSSASEVSGNTTVASWGVTGTQGFSSWDTNSSQFTLVNSPGVISTRSGSCDCINDLVIDLNGHAVASFDGFNLVPADCGLTQHISNGDSLIKEDNLWAKKENVGSQRNSNTDCCNLNETFSISDEEIVSKNSEAQENAKGKENIIASRAVRDNVTHSRIMTHTSNQGSKEALA